MFLTKVPVSRIPAAFSVMSLPLREPRKPLPSRSCMDRTRARAFMATTPRPVFMSTAAGAEAPCLRRYSRMRPTWVSTSSYMERTRTGRTRAPEVARRDSCSGPACTSRVQAAGTDAPLPRSPAVAPATRQDRLQGRVALRRHRSPAGRRRPLPWRFRAGQAGCRRQQHHDQSHQEPMGASHRSSFLSPLRPPASRGSGGDKSDRLSHGPRPPPAVPGPRPQARAQRWATGA